MINDFLRKILKLPTKKEQEELDFYSFACNHLVMDQIYRIIEIIDEEVAITRKKFGHKIELEDVFLEKRIILLTINATGGACSLRKKFDVAGQAYWDDIIKVVFKNLQAQVKKYFSKKTIPGRSRTWYNCHISLTVSRILNEIVNEKFPPP